MNLEDDPQPLEAAVTAEGPHAGRVVLIGFMGAGKTTVAREWASRGGPSRWFDSDTHALRLLGEDSVGDVFKRLGEPAWRTAEASVILPRAELPRAGFEVWSLGGGATLNPDVQRALFGSVVIWLDAPPEVLWERVQQGTDRPLAKDRSAFFALYHERRDHYRELADLHLDVSGNALDSHLPGAARHLISSELIWSRVLADRGALARLGEISCVQGRDVVVVADDAVSNHVAGVTEQVELAGGRVLDVGYLASGEWSKQLSSAESLWQRWSGSKVHRNTLVVALGGGTCLDVTGFAASAYNRGLDWLAVPTTLLAQVDAGTGGKTAVNLGDRKNIIGTIHEPSLTLIDPELLTTLPASELSAGMAEVIKTRLLAGPSMSADLPEALPDAARAGIELADVIAECARFKELVVTEDLADINGVRAQLNLGHTLAHAIEGATGGSFGHGPAVAVGLMVALELSRSLGLKSSTISETRSLLTAMGLPTVPPLGWEEVAPYLSHDKKRDESGIQWVMLRAIGDPLTRVRIPMEAVQAAWEQLRTNQVAGAAKLEGGAPVIHVLFGVNLGELGRRDPEQYGSQTLSQLVVEIEQWGSELGARVVCRQTDDLGRFLAAIREAASTGDALLINPGAWTHYERALHDALEPLSIPVVEVHLSDVMSREAWRHESVLEHVRDAVVSGEGAAGYQHGMRIALKLISGEPS